MPTYEMFWDCDRCGTEKVLGKSHRHCPNCGAPQDPSRRYFPPEDEKVAVEDHEFQGADVNCPNCDTPNAAAAGYCVNCGSALDGAKSVGTRSEVDEGGQAGSLKGERDAEKAREQAPVDAADGGSGAGAAAAGAGMFGMGCMALVGIVVVGGALLCLLNFFWTSSADLEVTGHSWTRTVEVEKLKTVKEDDWCSDMPSKARNVRKSKKKKKTRKVQDGETCKNVNVDNGDGTFKKKKKCTPKYRDEPVMADWCAWEEEKWKTDDTKRATGGLSDTPKWPDAKVSGCTTVGCTRVGTKTERFVVKLREPDGTNQECAVDPSKWKSMDVGSRWTSAKAVLTGSLTCTDLAPAK